MVKKSDLVAMVSKIEKENSLFEKKGYLDTLSFPSSVIGRELPTEQLARMLLQYKQGYLIPFIAVYGRSGSGKSTVVKFVCENLDGISYCFVNLRKSKTVFGAANLILAELGQPSIKSAQGLNMAVENIETSIKKKLEQEKKNFLVLVLDEFDILFSDNRGSPSDFIYKLLVVGEKLKEQDKMLCIISVSNNGLADYKLDDRVRSRIGSSEVFFTPYYQSDILEILKDRASKAFSKKIGIKILEHCAKLSSAGHGDARRAIDLLRVAGEIASIKGEDLTPEHIDLAQERLEKDRLAITLKSASFHLKLVCGGLARIAYLTDQQWHSTSTIYKQYQMMHSKISNAPKILGYRSVSGLLVELENIGLAVSETGSRGRYGYGSKYKLEYEPGIILQTFAPNMWEELAKNKEKYYEMIHNPAQKYPGDVRGKWDKYEGAKNWRNYVGL